MKKYKLIKEYPGSESIGYERTFADWVPHCITSYPEYWEEVRNNNPLKLEVGKTYILQYGRCESEPFKAKITRITKDGFPWMEKIDNSGNGIVSTNCYNLIEEVIEKDYEILSFKHKTVFYDKSDGIYFKTEHNKFNMPHTSFRHNYYSLDDMMVNPEVGIHSIRRLSDGEVFTVGDRCNPTEYPNNIHTITSIEFCRDGGPLRLRGSNWYMGINGIEHSKKPLFTTEDGVDIFEGDEFFRVWNIDNILKTDTYKCFANTGYAAEFMTKTTPHFSTKEAAEEYIDLNKPKCSELEMKEERKHSYEVGVQVGIKL